MYDLSIDQRARLHQTAFTYILPNLFLIGLYRDIIYRGCRIYMEIINHCSHITDMQQKKFLKCYSKKSKQKGSSTLLGVYTCQVNWTQSSTPPLSFRLYTVPVRSPVAILLPYHSLKLASMSTTARPKL
ncbi:hypothetical protein VPH35_050992 [Triticum aestivum]